MSKRILNAGMALAFLLCAPALQADRMEYSEPAVRQYLGGELSWLRLDKDRNTRRNGDGLGLYYGRQLAEHLWWESALGYYRVPTGAPLSRDYSQTHLMTGLAYAFGDRRGVTPYVIGQLGAIRHQVQPSDDKDTNLGINFGGGVVSAPLFANGLRLRADARYVLDTFDGDRGTNSSGDGPFGDWRLSLGIELPLGETRVVVRERVVEKTVVKTVEKPAAAATAEPQDSDGDGVPDRKDRCPNTPSGARVDSRGCLVANQRIVLRDILFETGSTKLTEASRRSLVELARSLASQKELKVEVSGYTDNTGRAETNLRLSQARAESVRNYLVEQGVDATRLTAKGYGPADPIASNATVSGRALNRRVELHLSGD